MRGEEEKTKWLQVGPLVRFPATETKPEGYIMELNMFPALTLKVFVQKPKEDAPKPAASQSDQSDATDPGPSDVNF